MSVYQSAINYARSGWAVFPCLPRGKAPATRHGLHDATTDLEQVANLWHGHDGFNVGIATGQKSGFWVLDIDGPNGEASLAALEAQYGPLPVTLTSTTGKGRHLLWALPAGAVIRNTASRIGDGIDTRGDGGYIVAPPSVHPSGRQYAWLDDTAAVAEAPQWLIEAATRQPRPAEAKPYERHAVESAPDGDWSADDVNDMLAVIHPDCDYQSWIEIGMALHEGGWPCAMWENWSRAGAKYKQGDCTRRWTGFGTSHGITMGTLIFHAEANGWKPKERERKPLDLADVDGVDLREFVANRKAKAKPVKVEVPVGKPLVLPVLVHDTIDWINSRSFKLQPELALMNTLGALGAVFGRRYALAKLDTRTNIYFVGIAESGQGKDESRKAIKKLMVEAGLDKFLGGESLRSGAGLLVELKRKPAMLTMLDEIGMFMKALFDQKAPAYLREVSALFTKLYSCSDNSYVGGLTASAPDEDTTIVEPNLCIYGTTTLGTYAEAMRKSAINSGELNRFIVLKSAVDYPEPMFDTVKLPPSADLVSRWAKFVPSGLEGSGVTKAQIVELGDMAERVNELLRYQDRMQKDNRQSGLSALWVRYRENVLKVAMILAIARNADRPVLCADDIDAGETIVGKSVAFMMNFANENMYDTEFERLCGVFMNNLAKGVDTRTAMIRNMKLKTKEMDDIERSLKESGRINFDEKSRPRVYEAT